MLDFSNKTFAEFFEDHFEINIYADAFSEKGTSKYNRLLSFIELSPPHLVVELLNLLWSRKNHERNAEIEDATYKASSDPWAVSPEYVEAVMSAAGAEDAPFRKTLDELASQPTHTILPHLSRVSAAWTLDTLEREFQRAFENLDHDPEASVTAACSMLESVCKSIIAARQITPPKSLDIQNRYKAIREPLGLSPNKNVVDSEIEADVRTILSGLSNSIQGIGALRTHSGTAHGRERGFRRLDPRIARLEVSTSSTLTLFLVETWEKRFPVDKLLPTE